MSGTGGGSDGAPGGGPPRGPAQAVLDLVGPPAMGRDDFLVAPCNAEAAGWLDRWPQWPSPALLLHGPAGSGKSHLGEIWRRRAQAVALPVAALEPQRLPELVGEAAAVLLDRAEAVAGDPERERALFHLHNLLAQRSGHWLGLAERPPALWPLRLPDLASRLRAAPAPAILPPDDSLIAAMLVKLFADRQLQPGTDVLTYLVNRCERSFDGVRRLVAAIDHAALATHRGVTVALAKDVIERLAGGSSGGG